MQQIREWMEANPDGAKELRRQNRSYVFFREVKLSDKDEAVGAQGVPLTPAARSRSTSRCMSMARRSSSRANCRSISEASKTPFRRLMIAQDTGSAIVGPARADLYFGAGAEAGKVAGRLRHTMRFVMLVPKSLDPSARGRKLPLPDERPSEKIAKLFPQVDPRKDQKSATKPRRFPRPTQAPPRAASRQPPSQAAGRKAGAAAGGPARHQAGSRSRPPPAFPPPSLLPMKRRLELDSRIRCRRGASAA